MQVVPIWGLAIPLPAVMMVTVTLYLMLVGMGFWIRYCLKDHCSMSCDCCPKTSMYEYCFRLGEMCNCRLPGVGALLPAPCYSPMCSRCKNMDCDCACTCQPPECDSCNCLCFEIRIK